MRMIVIDQTIQRLCREIHTHKQCSQNWHFCSEEDLLYEACTCIFGSQMVFEVAEAAAHTLKDQGLLRLPAIPAEIESYKKILIVAMSDSFSVTINGEKRKLRIRFRNRLASLLVATVANMRTQDQTLKKTLRNCSQLSFPEQEARKSQEARKCLIRLVCGFGPKQASLFLRRIGFCSDLAVLDTHIIDYLRARKGIDPKPSELSLLFKYEKIETEFRKIAEEFGYPIGCVDLAMWVTVRVAKREAVWCN